MLKYASIIGNDKKIIEKSKAIIESKKYILKYIFYNNVNFTLLKKIDRIYIDANLPTKFKDDIYRFSIDNNKELYVIPVMIDIGNTSKLLRTSDMLTFKIDDLKLSLFQKLIKRIFDIIFSITVITILSPLMITIFCLIKIFDPGPAIYLQKRLTINGKEFILIKFRTMIYKAEAKSGVTLSTKNDSRVTKIGNFLRRTRLDEIPQIFNVLIGDMSVVGPRPERRYYVKKFTQENENYKYRFRVKAGITGLAQINCRYNTKYCDKLQYDLLYIQRYSLLSDLKIIIKTIKIIFDKNSTEGIKEENFEELLKKNHISIFSIEPGIIELRNINEKNSI